MATTDLDTHLSSFQSIWKGGFLVGDPLDRLHSPFGVETRELERYRRHIELPEGPEGSWWYDATTRRTASMVEVLGYRVVEADVGVDPRSPIIHFVRP